MLTLMQLNFKFMFGVKGRVQKYHILLYKRKSRFLRFDKKLIKRRVF